MKYFKVIVVALFLCINSVFSQDNSIKHSVVKGETISSIAQKYNVSIASIYKLNPEAKKTLHLNQIILIPNSESTKSVTLDNSVSDNTHELKHEVLPKETLYGIIKQFKTTKELLYKANPRLETEGLKTGQNIVVPSRLTLKEIASLTNVKKEETVETTHPLIHQVKAKESLYVIAKEYGISLKELQNANPNIGNKGLSIGQEIMIPNKSKSVENETVVDSEKLKTNEASLPEERKPVVVNEKKVEDKEVSDVEIKSDLPLKTEDIVQEAKSDSENQTAEITHVVLTKETKYGIAKKYGITVSDLEKQNPSIQQRLDVGEKLRIQVSNKSNLTITPVENLVGVSQIQVEKPQDSTSLPIGIANEDLINKLIQSASDKIGTRYRTGGTTTDGFDCSGLMCNTFGSFDIKLPRSSIEQSSFGEKIDNNKAQKGDLIFFKTSGRSRINHVGMVVEVIDDEIKFIHSSTHSGVIISSTKEAYYQRTFAQVNRVVK